MLLKMYPCSPNKFRIPRKHKMYVLGGQSLQRKEGEPRFCSLLFLATTKILWNCLLVDWPRRKTNRKLKA